MTIGICIIGIALCIECIMIGFVLGSIFTLHKISHILDEKAEHEYYSSIYRDPVEMQ